MLEYAEAMIADAADGHRRAVGPAARRSSARRRWSSSRPGSALANLYARTNVALGIESEGFAASCGLPPLAQPSRRSVAGMTDDPFVAHRSLLFTVAYEMLGSAADAEDVVQETWLRWADLGADGTGRGARPAGLPGADRHPAGAQPAAHAGAPARGLRRRVAARAAADQPRRGRRRRARGERVDRDAHRAGDARRRPSGRCSCCARCSTSRTTRSPRRSARPRPRCGRSPTAPASTSPRGGRGTQVSRAEQQRSSSGSSPPSAAATCRGCSTCSRPTSSWWPTAAAWSPRSGARSSAPTGWQRSCRGLAQLTAGRRDACRSGSTARPAARVDVGGELDTVMSLVVEDGRITRIYAVRNPHKLGRVGEETALTR